MSKLSSMLCPVVGAIERFSDWSGRVVSWLVLAMVLLISYDVAMRYLFENGSIALQELEWHLFALIFLLGAAYTMKQDAHVRVDLLYSNKRFSDRHRAWINILGGIFFLVPFCLLIIYTSWPFVEMAYSINETSPDPGGLPYRFLIKAAIPLGFMLLLIQGLAHIAHNILKVTQPVAKES